MRTFLLPHTYGRGTRMSQSARVTVAGMALVCALIPAGCTVFDAFGPTGPRGISFTFAGDTVLNVGDVVPVAVTVVAQGVPLTGQPLRVAITPDSTRVTLNATGDSLIGCRAGQAAMLVQLLHSSSVGTATPDTAIVLRVTGGAPPGARCP